jgi:hypothetical protein
VTLPPQWEKDALALVEQASPLEGQFFCSVELAYGHPDDMISGEGTQMYAGRFVKPGSRAVYGSADEETAFKESAARSVGWPDAEGLASPRTRGLRT